MKSLSKFFLDFEKDRTKIETFISNLPQKMWSGYSNIHQVIDSNGVVFVQLTDQSVYALTPRENYLVVVPKKFNQVYRTQNLYLQNLDFHQGWRRTVLAYKGFPDKNIPFSYYVPSDFFFIDGQVHEDELPF